VCEHLPGENITVCADYLFTRGVHRPRTCNLWCITLIRDVDEFVEVWNWRNLDRTLSFPVKVIGDVGNDSDAELMSSEMSTIQSDAVLREWRESAAYWQKHSDTIRSMFSPVTQALIDEAGIVAGQSILDVAGGAGEPSLTIAGIVGPAGSVTCTDATAEMVFAAEREGERRGLTNVVFRQSGADALPFESESFDAVVCRLGVMFFPDPPAALREMLRVTKPSGIMALAVWDKSELNPFFYVVTNVVSRYSEVAPADPNAPGAFRFAERGALAQILSDAGASDINERVLKFQITASISPEQFWEMRSEISGTLREKLATLSAQQADLLSQEVQEAVGQFFSNNQMSIPAQMIIVTARKR
jgi:ubiquinone/menaquinone biosynthesis C-methylase UbiE